MLDLDADCHSRQHRNVGRLYGKIYDLTVSVGLNAVAGKALDSQHILG